MNKFLRKMLLVNKLDLRLLVLAMSVVLSSYAQSGQATNEAGASFQPPQLPEGGGDAVVVRAIQLRVKYPKQALRDEVQGQLLVSFAVSPRGQICLIKIEQGIRPDLDTAVVQAVRQLPQLQPATQYGKSVACLMRAPVTFTINNRLRAPRRPLPAADSTQLAAAVTRMPIYQEKIGYQSLAADLTAECLRGTQGNTCSLPKFGAQVVLTVEPSGRIDKVERLRDDEAQKAALEALFGDQVAQKENNEEEVYVLSDACLSQLAEVVRHLPHLTPAYVADQPVAMRLILKLTNPNSPY